MNIGSIFVLKDNSGAKKAVFLRQLIPYSMYDKQDIRAGNLVLVTIRKVIANNIFKVKKGTLYKAIVVLLNKNIRRNFGFIRFLINAVVLLSKKGLPFATRIFIPILREVRLKKHMRIVILCVNVF